MPVGAIGGLVGGIGSMIGGSQAAHESDKANQINQQNLAPWLKYGQQALTNLSDPNQLMKNFYTSPNYQFTMKEGLNAVGTDKAVNGLLKSGSALKSLTGYASNLAAGQFNNYVNQQQFLSNQGLGAATGANQSNWQNAQNQGNADINMGNAFGNIAGGLYGAFSGSSYGG